MSAKIRNSAEQFTHFTTPIFVPYLRWDDPSIFVPTAAIPVQLKCKGDGVIEEEKKTAKRAKTSKETKKKIEGADREVKGKRKGDGGEETSQASKELQGDQKN
ncbi:hypothetical protein DFH08DRAFT_818566 [Mycena albidolilacea]|uniref:Uncharacterized protein n=1 Tax=Mycena albidolilacea TaxID=1033008 RepID=A0AAD6ZGB0_9AGAR|nr:hypothetical protein DFH08DRAFT_818566 [Mycena albidolilacea]